MPVSEAMTIETHEIDGAACRLKGDELQYQPRNDKGEMLWVVWTRDGFYDGWTADLIMATDGNEAMYGSRVPARCAPEFVTDAIGWTIEQITQAKVWAGDVLATRKIARTFAPVREAAE